MTKRFGGTEVPLIFTSPNRVRPPWANAGSEHIEPRRAIPITSNNERPRFLFFISLHLRGIQKGPNFRSAWCVTKDKRGSRKESPQSYRFEISQWARTRNGWQTAFREACWPTL